MIPSHLRDLLNAMIAASEAYKRADPDVVHIAHAEFKAARFRYNVACGEYVAEQLEKEECTSALSTKA
ncbi:hypothetical protein KLEP174_gp44 [Pseudomonas phage vB_PcuM_ KLEP17-4]|nr:hypothetical protein KLEP174_gp44 [Pseudomonas phage vB_PcuM_ KLEP17-4]